VFDLLYTEIRVVGPLFAIYYANFVSVRCDWYNAMY